MTDRIGSPPHGITAHRCFPLACFDSDGRGLRQVTDLLHAEHGFPPFAGSIPVSWERKELALCFKKWVAVPRIWGVGTGDPKSKNANRDARKQHSGFRRLPVGQQIPASTALEAETDKLSLH